MSSSPMITAQEPSAGERRREEVFRRIAGALFGAAAADALGWSTEFVRGPEHLRKLYGVDRIVSYRPWQKTTGGRFNSYIDYISKGEYSDDTQLTLAVARAILPDGSVDMEHFANSELPLWLPYARGAGSTITAAAKSMTRKSARWDSNFFTYKHRGQVFDYRSSGANGAAMRMGPIALANIDRPDHMRLQVWRNAIATHGHPRGLLGALLYAEALRVCVAEGPALSPIALPEALMDGVDAARMPDDDHLHNWRRRWESSSKVTFQEAWDRACEEARAGLRLVTHSSEGTVASAMHDLGCFEPATKGSGVGTVLAGILLFSIFGHNFPTAVLNAVNAIGSDTDTIGGFVGGLCGAHLGYDALPDDWVRELQDNDYFLRAATEITKVAQGEGLGGRALLPERAGETASLPDVETLLSRREITKEQGVYHRLFGRGWVRSVDAQRLRRKDGAEVVLAWVNFYIGQSCKFHFMRIPRRTDAKPAPTAPPTAQGRLFP